MSNPESMRNEAARLLNSLRADRYIARNFADEIFRLGSLVESMERDRLAALAGAAPVAWQYRVKWSLSSGWSDWADCSADFAQRNSELKTHQFRPLFTHAPAKAREVTEVDVERAARAYLSDAGLDPDEPKSPALTSAMRAALATFAEGE